MSRIFVLHENSPWVEPLADALNALGLPFEEWFLDEGTVPFDAPPPAGVYYNRMSASSHTRGHRYAPELAHLVLTWLESHGRRVVNRQRALSLEISKLDQYAALNRASVRTPRTTAVVGRERVLDAVQAFGPGPYILKPNRGGKGLGVQLFASRDAVAAYLDALPPEETPIDGTWLVQEYIRAAEPFITRCEFVGGRFHYAVRVDTSGGFELCPADACEIGEAFCPTGTAQSAKFTIDPAFHDPILANYERFLGENEVEIAGIEFIRDRDGVIYTYDVNTNTNYNAAAEAAAGVPETGMHAVARFLGAELAKQRAAAAA